MTSQTYQTSNSLCLMNKFIRKLMRYEPELVFAIQHTVEPATKLKVGDLSNIGQMKQTELAKGYYPSRIDIALEYIVDDSIFELFDKDFTRNLIEINLDKLELLTDEGLIHIGKSCNKLKRIRISNCDTISHQGFKQFIENSPFLTKFIVNSDDFNKQPLGNYLLSIMTNCLKIEYCELGRFAVKPHTIGNNSGLWHTKELGHFEEIVYEDDSDSEGVYVQEIEIDGNIYYWETDTNDVYDPETSELLGKYTIETNTIN